MWGWKSRYDEVHFCSSRKPAAIDNIEDPYGGGFPNSCAIVCCRPYDMLGKILTSKKKKNTDSLCATMYYEINKSKFAKIKASAFWKNGLEGTNSGDLNICVY